MGQPIRRPIQRRFGPSCVRRVYFPRKSTEFYDMQTVCWRINNYHSFLTVLLISHKSPVIAQLLTPQSIPNCSLVYWSCADKILPCLKVCKLESSFKDSLSCSRYLFSKWTFKNIFTWDPSDWPCSHNTPNVSPPLRSPERPPRPHNTPQRRSGQNYRFHLGLLSTYNPPAPHCEFSPKFFNQVKRLWRWKGTILLMIYSIKIYRGRFGKIWIRKFIYVIFHI